MTERPTGDKFAPLTPQEHAAVSAVPRDKSECVIPVPQDAPPIPTKHPGLGKLPCRWPYLDKNGALLFEVCRFETPDGKEFRPLSLWRASNGRLEWKWKGVPEPRPLYGLDRLTANSGAPVIVCEGEKSADAAAKIFPKSVAVTSPGGSQAASKADWAPLDGRKVMIWADADEPGGKYAEQVAAILAARACEVSIFDAAALASMAPDGSKREPEKGWDAADALIQWRNLAALGKAAAGLAKPFEATSATSRHDSTEAGSEMCDVDQEITRLAGLCVVEYEKGRKDAATKLGIRVAILDKLVAAERPKEDKQGQGRPLEFPEPEPWPEPVDGAELVPGLVGAICRYVILTENDALAAALWILHAFCFDAFPCTPRLAITSPEKRCGKTTLLDVIAALVPKALSTANITAAATFRTIESARPTLMIDEADTFLGENEELRGILNSGHRAGGQVIRTVGDDFEPRAFSTHCPCVIAMIGKLPDTLADRGINIEMKRRAPGEKVARFRLGRTLELAEASRKAARWVADNIESIRESGPDIPGAIYNRAADNWEPLLAIAVLRAADGRNARGKRPLWLAA